MVALERINIHLIQSFSESRREKILEASINLISKPKISQEKYRPIFPMNIDAKALKKA